MSSDGTGSGDQPFAAPPPPPDPEVPAPDVSAPEGAIPVEGEPAAQAAAVTDEAVAAVVADLAAEGSGEVPGAVHGDPTPMPIDEDAVVALVAERDEYLVQLQRMKAEFANFRRRSSEGAELVRRQAAADLAGRLLPILDSAQAALDQGVEEVRPLNDALTEVLTGQGLVTLDPVGEPFDPEQHEAVMFEPGDDPEQVVVETMRLGYMWNDRVLRAAMVKVRG